MNEWRAMGVHRVNALLAGDADYQKLKRQLNKAQESYRKATENLSAEQKEQIDEYIALCEEIEYQKTVTAYYCGKRNG